MLKTLAIYVAAAGAIWSIWYLIVYIASVLWRLHGKSEAERRTDARFAVLIPTYNDDVSPAVKGVLAADYPKDRVDIYIIDSSSDDEVLRRNRAWAERGNITWWWKDRRGFKAGALNFALDRIDLDRYDYVVVLDADGIVDKEFFARIAADFERTGADAIQTVWKNYTRKHTLLSYYAWVYAGLFHRLVVPVLNFFNSALIFGNGFAVRAGVFKNLRLNERYVAEDFKLALDIIENGGKIVFIEDYGVTTTQPRDLKNMEKQLSRWAYGSTQIFFEEIIGKLRINPATFIVIMTWLSAYVLTPASLILITAATVAYGWILTDIYVIYALYVVGLSPLAVSAVAYFSRDDVDLPLYKKILSFLMGLPFWFVFSGMGATKYILGKGPSWHPTEKVVRVG